MVVIMWLKLIHPDLVSSESAESDGIEQSYGHAAWCLLGQRFIWLWTLCYQKFRHLKMPVMHSFSSNHSKSSTRRDPNDNSSVPGKSCPLCKATGQPYQHFLSKFNFLSQSDRRFMVSIHHVETNNCSDNEEDNLDVKPEPPSPRLQQDVWM